MGDAEQDAMTGGYDTTTEQLELVPELPAESVTLTFAVFVPVVGYVFDADDEVPESPSIPLQLYVYPVPVPPLTFVAVQLTLVTPAIGEAGDTEQDAVTGGYTAVILHGIV